MPLDLTDDKSTLVLALWRTATESSAKTQHHSCKKISSKISSAKLRPFGLGRNVLTQCIYVRILWTGTTGRAKYNVIQWKHDTKTTSLLHQTTSRRHFDAITTSLLRRVPVRGRTHWGKKNGCHFFQIAFLYTFSWMNAGIQIKLHTWTNEEHLSYLMKYASQTIMSWIEK